MLGMVFTEFLDMVEARFSPDVADAIILEADPPHGGAYTAVGHYPHEEMVALVVALSRSTATPVPALLTAFGSHLMGRFRALYPPMFAAHADLFDFLASVDGGIHREVKKLYPAAILPRVHVVERAPGRIVLAYVSPRHLDDLAAGLIEGAAREFATPVEIQAAPGEHEGQPALVFDVRRVG